MQHLNHTDRDFVAHAAEVMADRIADNGDCYTDSDVRAVDKLEAIGNGGTALVLTGVEMNEQARNELMRLVLQAELDHWVPGSSQRLIWRAANALVIPVTVRLDSPLNAADCGTERRWHSLTSTWIAGRYLMVCSTCSRLYA